MSYWTHSTWWLQNNVEMKIGNWESNTKACAHVMITCTNLFLFVKDCQIKMILLHIFTISLIQKKTKKEKKKIKIVYVTVKVLNQSKCKFL